MGFGVFECRIEVVPAPGGGGGGGSFAVYPEIFRPYKPFEVKRRRPPTKEWKTVKISVKYRRQVWDKSFTVPDEDADVVIKVLNMVSKTKQKYASAVEAFKEKVTSMKNFFTPKEK